MKKIVFIFFAVFIPALMLAGDFKLMSGAKPYFKFRPRFEFVNIDVKGGGDPDDAKAFTARTVLGSKFLNLFGANKLNLTFEVTNVSSLNDDLYKYYDNGGWRHSHRAPVLDPPFTRVTQSYIDFTVNKTKFIFGRKLTFLDNHRFLGTVGWRQMPQVFGVIGIEDTTIPKLKVFAAYLYERRGIQESLNADWRHGQGPIFINVSYNLIPELKITAYDYMITDKHDTLGLRLTGKIKFNGTPLKLSYELEYAHQSDPSRGHNDDIDADADYFNIGLKFLYKGFIFGGGYELLGDGDANNGEKGFNTPFATLHKFQGWSDVLLGVEASGSNYVGLQDIYGLIGYKNKKFGKLVLIYHDFQTDDGSDDYGSEWNMVYVRKLNFIDKNLSFLIKGAYFDGDDEYSAAYDQDVTKIWVMLNYKFTDFKKLFK